MPTRNNNGAPLPQLEPDIAAEIRKHFTLILEPGQVVELRALEARSRDWNRPHTVAGYFNDIDKFATEAATLTMRGRAQGVYFTLNVVDPALIARAANHVRDVKHDPLTGNGDIVRRSRLLIDADAVRPTGISSTDKQHDAALERIREIHDALTETGWPLPIHADSGNGGHLLYRINLPADDDGLVKRVLEALASQFDDGIVNIDTGVHNPARICKVYGTWVRKGDDTPERPHRLARVIEAPASLEVVHRDLLEALAGKAVLKASTTSTTENRSKRQVFDLPKWVADHQLDVTGAKPWEGGQKWVFHTCPWDPSHVNDSAYIVQHANGAVAAGCHHQSCKNKAWHDLRDVVEPGWRDRFHLSDLGNARRLVARHGTDLHFSTARGKWLIWDGRRWRVDDNEEVVRWAKATAEAIYDEVRAETDQTKRIELAKHAIRSEGRKRLEDMISLAESEPGIPVTADQLDADLWFLNCLNGTLDLRTGELRAHCRQDLITKLAPVEYDPQAACPTWDKFLNRIFADKERLIRFLQRVMGYALTGDVREQMLLFLHGLGANGKTTLLNTILHLLGNYAKQADPELLIAKKNESHPTNVASLCGVRFAVTTEVERGKALAEALVKQLTGGDRITARFMCKDFFEFDPSHKIFLSANHKPVIRGADHAMWRRIHLIPFDVVIPEKEQDKGLVSKLVTEGAGILAWAVRGCLDWQQNGLGVPEEVTAATQTYREEMDRLGSFFEECCTLKPTATAPFKVLYHEYTRWAERNHERAVSKKSFGAMLSERGIPANTGTGGERIRLGVELLGTCGGVDSGA